jgi:outer membrane lipoprotein-sorting protein
MNPNKLLLALFFTFEGDTIMYKAIIIIATLLLFTVSHAQAKTDVYGKGVHLKETTKISDLLDHPDTYLGKRVKVSGMVIEVCAKRGCWIYLSSDRPYEKIQIKVTDGEIVFPMNASGHQATVEGTVEELNMSKQDLINYKKHLAEERGLPFDPSTVKEGEKIIRIIGLGAEIDS